MKEKNIWQIKFIVRANRKEYKEGLNVCQALEELFMDMIRENPDMDDTVIATELLKDRI